MKKQRTTVRYWLVTDFIGDPKNGHANGYDSKSFVSKRKAIEHWRKEYKNRNVGDGYDEYWRNKPCYIQKETTITEMI